MDKLLKGLTIISLSGAQGSGKSTLGSELANYLKTLHVETSNVVHKVTKLDRENLYWTGVHTQDDPDWLGREIGKRILKFLPGYKRKTAVLSGVRELEVHSYLRRQGARLHIFEITADPQLRFKRLRDLEKVSSARHFLDKELNERQLGLPKVLEQAKYKVETRSEVPASDVVRAIQKKLVAKGVKCN